jgi:serine/threonine-protein kinase
MDNAIQPASQTATTPPLTPSIDQHVDLTGQVLGEFRLLRWLASGGMGQVYLAEQTSLKRKVAIKLLHGDMAASERSLLRFKAEAENAARATHANIVQIYTIGQANGIHYIALEYVEGKNLREFIEKKGTPELSLGLHIMAQVAQALQRASEFRVLHRDIKPENIMLTKKGEVKVADFGLSRWDDEANPVHITQSQVVMGTPLYMSPEQVEHKPLDSRTDIYSFGATSYYMFAGHPPFRGNSPVEVAYQHLHNEPQSLAEIRPDLPAELCTIIHRMMAKKPDDRYQSAREIARDVNRLRDSLNLGSVGALSISSSFLGAADGVHGSSTQLWNAETPRHRRWRRVLLSASVLLVLAGSFALGWFQRNGNGKDPALNAVPIDEPAPPINTKEKEKELQDEVQKYLDPENKLDELAGLKHFLDLGLLYLKQKKYDDADKLFKTLKAHKNKPYNYLGSIGDPIVLAFKDNYAASNKEFVAIMTKIEKYESLKGIGKADRPFKKNLTKEELAELAGKAERLIKKNLTKEELAELRDVFEAHKLLWQDNPRVHEMVAKALNYNYANAPKEFPEKLQSYRFPPRATLKAAPQAPP